MLRIITIAVVTLVIGYVSFHVTPRMATRTQLTSISELARDPSRYEGRRVAVMGTVNDAAGFFGHGEYHVQTLDDGSDAQIVVWTDSGVPPENTVVIVHGVVRQALVVGRTQYAVIVQDDRHGSGF
jgi:hypothetical protein